MRTVRQKHNEEYRCITINMKGDFTLNVDLEHG